MNKHVVEGVVILVFIAGLHFLAQIYDLYYIFWWVDWTFHFFGGVGIALIASSIFKRRSSFVFLATGVIAVGWEIFERVGHRYLPQYIAYGGTGDTIMDILCAILGTALVLFMNRN